MAFYEGVITDKNGDEIHFGDTVENGNGTVYYVNGYESPEGSGVARLIIIRYGGPDENFQVWWATISSENVTLVKPKETFDEVALYVNNNYPINMEEVEEIGRRFLNCEEASHE